MSIKTLFKTYCSYLFLTYSDNIQLLFVAIKMPVIVTLDHEYACIYTLFCSIEWLICALSALQTSDYQSKKKLCRRLRQKLFHIKGMVKDYDKNHSWIHWVLTSALWSIKQTQAKIHSKTLQRFCETKVTCTEQTHTHTHTYTGNIPHVNNNDLKFLFLHTK